MTDIVGTVASEQDNTAYNGTDRCPRHIKINDVCTGTQHNLYFNWVQNSISRVC